MIGLAILTDQKHNSYDSILVIIDQLTKIVHYEPVKIIINIASLAKIILYIVIRYHGLLDSIIIDKSLFFTLKFWSFLCYFLGIKYKFLITFYRYTDDQTKRQNSTIEAYLYIFINFNQNNQIKFLPITKFAYNNTKNASTGYALFELNCDYHFCVSYKEDIDLYSKSKLANKLLSQL